MISRVGWFIDFLGGLAMVVAVGDDGRAHCPPNLLRGCSSAACPLRAEPTTGVAGEHDSPGGDAGLFRNGLSLLPRFVFYRTLEIAPNRFGHRLWSCDARIVVCFLIIEPKPGLCAGAFFFVLER